MLCNGVFAGGGVRGIGYVGAIKSFEDYGYEFIKVAGTSAGAIIASLVAAGYTGDEMLEIMQNADYVKFCEKKLLNKLGIVGDILSLLMFYGVYSTNYFEEWLNELLMKKGVHTFKDLKLDKTAYKLQVTASDLTKKRLVVFPQDAVLYGIKPDEMSVSFAVRMSISIPFFYKPVVLKDRYGAKHHIADGGLLCNYPIFLLDKYLSPSHIPTFGFKFVNNDKVGPYNQNTCDNIIEYCKFSLETLLNAQDNIHISVSSGDYARTVFVPVNIIQSGKKNIIGATDFEITKDQAFLMYSNGTEAAERFLENWSFSQWKNKYRRCEI